MLLKQLHWLDVLEYVSYGITLICLLIAIAADASELSSYPLIGLTITLGLNIINRLRTTHAVLMNRTMVERKVRQLQRQWTEEIEPITHQVSHQSESTTQTLAVVQENLIHLEQSLNGIIQYLNNHALRERVERIERAYFHLKKDLLNSFGESTTLSLKEIEPPLTDLPTSLPIVNLVSTPSPVPRTEWDCIYSYQGHSDAIAAVAISSDGKLLASGSWDHTLKVWNLLTGEAINVTDAHDQAVLAVIFTEDTTGYHLASGSFDHTIKLWSLSDSHLSLNHLLTAHTGSIHALTFAPRESLLLSGSYDQSVKQWQVDHGAMVASSYESLGAIYALALDPDERWLASAGGDGSVSLWKIGTGDKLGNLIGNISSIKSLAINPDGQILGAGCVDGTIKLWQLELNQLRSAKPCQPIRTFWAHQGQVQAILFSHDGEFLISSGADGEIKIWHPSRSDAIATLNLSDGSTSRLPSVLSLTMSKDGQYLAAGGSDGMIKVWQKS